MATMLVVTVLMAGAMIALLAVLGPQPLLRWYLREIRPMKVAERPDEAIVTYPLA